MAVATTSSFAPASTAPAVLVLNAFDAGGAQLAGTRGAHVFTLADDLDIAAGRHAIRAGILLDAGRYRHRRAPQHRRHLHVRKPRRLTRPRAPTTFTRNIGNPEVAVSQVQLGLYLQDDYARAQGPDAQRAACARSSSRTSAACTWRREGASRGRRSRAARRRFAAAAACSTTGSTRRRTSRACSSTARTSRSKRSCSPAIPIATLGGRAIVLPAGRVQFAPDLEQPQLLEAIAGVEQTLPGEVRVNAMYIRRRGSNLMRGVNVNAPLANGLRPDPLSGTVTEIQSVGRSQLDAISLNVNYARPQQRLFLAANYTFGRSIDETDSLFSLPAEQLRSRGRARARARLPAAPVHEHGEPAAEKALPSRHVAPGPVGPALQHHDRTRRQRRHGQQRSAGGRDAQRRPRARAGGPRHCVSVGAWRSAVRPRRRRGRRFASCGATTPIRLAGWAASTARTSATAVELYAQSYNTLNRVNALNFSGVVSSPFFGQPTSAAAPRRIEVGTRFSF